MGNNSEYESFSAEMLNYSKEELKHKLLKANKSEFLAILELGSGIVLEGESVEQRKRKGLREMFFEIWRDIL